MQTTGYVGLALSGIYTPTQGWLIPYINAVNFRLWLGKCDIYGVYIWDWPTLVILQAFDWFGHRLLSAPADLLVILAHAGKA
eukprot:1141220-Pelagomonas_calceolata.AAC.1